MDEIDDYDIEKAFWTSNTKQEYYKYISIERNIGWSGITPKEYRFYRKIKREYTDFKNKMYE